MQAPIGQQIQASIDEARQLGGMPRAAGAPAVAATSKAQEPQKKSPASAPSAMKSVSGTVSVAGSLGNKFSPTDAVFVFARPADGSRMPIAILKAQAKDLPLKFTLDDSSAMSPQVKLSGFDQVIVAARISKSGNAMPASGDLEGSTQPVKVGSAGITLTIDRVLP